MALAIGLAIGWIVKPTPAAPAADLAKVAPPKTSPRKDPKPTPPTADKTKPKVTSSFIIGGRQQPGEMSDDDQSQAKKMQKRMEEMMQKRQEKKLEARILKLVAQLNLTPEQEAALRKAAAENQVDAASLMSGDFDPSQLANLSADGSIEDSLADILTDEQKEEHAALKKRELANKIESKALQNLAKLGDLDMTQEQKDAAYDILYKQAEETTTDEESSANGILSAVTEGLGLEIDPDDLDFGAISATEAENGEAPNQQDLMARMQESQQRKIEEKIEALRPVLNDDQLEQYRQSLNLRQGGILGGVLGGFSIGGSEEE